jgi:hypothetical protein
VKPLKLLALGGAVLIASALLIFAIVDFSALSEPSWAERQMASNVLSLKIRLSRPGRAAPGQFERKQPSARVRRVSAQLRILPWKCRWQTSFLC